MITIYYADVKLYSLLYEAMSETKDLQDQGSDSMHSELLKMQNYLETEQNVSYTEYKKGLVKDYDIT